MYTSTISKILNTSKSEKEQTNIKTKPTYRKCIRRSKRSFRKQLQCLSSETNILIADTTTSLKNPPKQPNSPRHLSFKSAAKLQPWCSPATDIDRR